MPKKCHILFEWPHNKLIRSQSLANSVELAPGAPEVEAVVKKLGGLMSAKLSVLQVAPKIQFKMPL